MRVILYFCLGYITLAFDNIDFYAYTSHAAHTTVTHLNHYPNIAETELNVSRYRRTLDDNGFFALSFMYAASGFMIAFTLITAVLFFITFLDTNDTQVYYKSKVDPTLLRGVILSMDDDEEQATLLGKESEIMNTDQDAMNSDDVCDTHLDSCRL